ncbi:MAG: extracellular solute-binding protein, partial [Chloroflexota bacterium]
VDALMLNISSSQNQTELAMLLARFLTNSDQGGVFVRQSGIIPANRRVRIDEVAYPAEAGFRTQAQSAVSIPNLPQMTTVLEQADNLMIQVLEGVITEAEAARIITTTTNETHGYETEIVRNEDCTLEGELLLWHTLEGRPASTLGLIADNYMARCTDVSVELVFVDPEDEDPLDAFLGEVVAPPALLLGDANWTGRLVALSQVAPVTNATVQTYLPASIQQLISDGTVYGIPFSVSTLGLYYNPSQVETVATSLTELRTQAGEEALGLAMPIGFNDLYWGYTATDGQLVDASNVFVFDAQAWLQWLDWLDQTGNFETVRFSNDRNLLLDAFISGEVAYYIGTPQDFVDIETVMGTDSFAITTLPSGTGGEPTSALDVEAFFINNRVQETQVAIAQDFAIFATGSDQQQILLETTGLIPANVNIVLEDTAPVRPWFEQVQNAVPLPTSPEIETLRTDGTLIIDGVIRGSTTPQDGVTALGTLFDISITFDPTTNAPITTEEATEEVE